MYWILSLEKNHHPPWMTFHPLIITLCSLKLRTDHTIFILKGRCVEIFALKGRCLAISEGDNNLHVNTYHWGVYKCSPPHIPSTTDYNSTTKKLSALYSTSLQLETTRVRFPARTHPLTIHLSLIISDARNVERKQCSRMV